MQSSASPAIGCCYALVFHPNSVAWIEETGVFSHEIVYVPAFEYVVIRRAKVILSCVFIAWPFCHLWMSLRVKLSTPLCVARLTSAGGCVASEKVASTYFPYQPAITFA